MFPSLRSFFTHFGGISVNVLSQFKQHKCFHHAASLAFSSLIGFVPLSAVTLYLLKTFGVVENEESPLIATLNNFFPRYRADEIVAGISEFTNRNLTGLGVGGFLLFLVVSVLLFMSIEGHFNGIWGIDQRLPFVKAFQKYLVFCLLLLVGPLVIFFIFSSVDNRLLANLFPLILICFLLFFMYIALPNATVNWKAALFGTFVAGTLFQIARIAFSNYFELVWQDYSAVYGTLAMLVILAIWIYVTWIVILLGVEVTHSIQYSNYKKGSYGKAINENNNYINDLGVITLFLIVAVHFQKGKGACSVSDVAATARVSESLVHKIFNRFKAAKFIYEVEGDTKGYLPACSLSKITFDSLVASVDGDLTCHFTDALPASPKLMQLFREIQQTQADMLKNITVSSFLDSDSNNESSHLDKEID
jgi:membrane protein